MTKFKLEIQGQQKEIEISRQGATYHIELGDRSVACRISAIEDASFVLELIWPDGTRHQIHAAGTTLGDERQIWVDGQTLRYRRLRYGREEVNQESALATTIPAIVTEILVAPGDFVTAGTKLVLLESMKMIIPIQAPYDGVVDALHCKRGDAVQAGIKLVTLVKKDAE